MIKGINLLIYSVKVPCLKHKRVLAEEKLYYDYSGTTIFIKHLMGCFISLAL